MKRIMAKLDATFPRRSHSDLAEEQRKIWPALLIAAPVFAYFIAPLGPLLSPGLMAGSGVLAVCGIVGFPAANAPQSNPWGRAVVGTIIGLAFCVLLLAVGKAVAISNANAKWCAELQSQIVTGTSKNAIDAFQALQCRPAALAQLSPDDAT